MFGIKLNKNLFKILSQSNDFFESYFKQVDAIYLLKLFKIYSFEN